MNRVAIMNMTTIQISVKLRERLKKLGTKGETYETIIWRLIEKLEKAVDKQ
jgi:predicted CopG family antitoxin